MHLTFSLSDAQFAANDRTGVMVGLPLTVQIDAGPLVLGPDDTAGWFVPANYGAVALKTISLDRVAFCGRISQIEQWRSEEDVVCQALLDCGWPVRVDLLDPFTGPGKGDPQFQLATGDWLVGVASLRGLLAFDAGDLLWSPVQGTIVDIQRLVLDASNPTFGTLRWLHGLPRQSFAPDQVFVTLDVK
jgi:hypothetical protein